MMPIFWFLTVVLSSCLVNSMPGFVYRRSLGGAISPREQGRQSNKKYSFNFYPSRELTGQGIHFIDSDSASTKNVVYRINQIKKTPTNHAVITRQVNNYGYKPPEINGNNGYGPQNGFGAPNSFESIGIFTGDELQNGQEFNNVGFSNGFASYGQPETIIAPSYGQQPVIQKNIYIHIPPPELEENYPPQVPLQLGQPEKNYKIIFIKAPSPPNLPQTVIPQQPLKEEKTLVYVLVKKPEIPSAPIVAPAAPTQPSKPEVFFIRYKTKKEQGNQNEGQSYAAPSFENQSAKPGYLPTNQQAPVTEKTY